jgi:putative RecB family exonuclease
MVQTVPLEDQQSPGEEAPRPRRPALSPSRAADFKQCPLLYRFRTVDRLPERPTPAQVRGTVVHSVLERLFALPREQRLPDRARELIGPVWNEQLASRPELAELPEVPDAEELTGDEALPSWLASADKLLEAYFQLEDPRRLDPESCEQLVEAELESGVLLRGYVDRIDVAPTGEIRVVDYKTGAAPRAIGEAKAMFQMKFYALVLYRLRGVVPRQLRLMYLTDAEALSYTPEEAELQRFERTLEAMWKAILKAAQTGDFRPSPSKLCDYCDHKERCPEFGGTPPPYPGWPEPDAGQETVFDKAE